MFESLDCGQRDDHTTIEMQKRVSTTGRGQKIVKSWLNEVLGESRLQGSSALTDCRLWSGLCKSRSSGPASTRLRCRLKSMMRRTNGPSSHSDRKRQPVDLVVEGAPTH
ncbi:hypothetical protein HRR83_006687 [Exophiala dermatitidis]|uniref:Uncharacterized protein n=1 Tax=Exophiala dermatitidis TaxID=5970 RepID=A0AAN6ERW5_EXODE|nr:hypothetical protein HRR74_005847 [Exophiala dermatitidis]KAJ4515328.1 hypothetical protein HRR73_005159 [Exophiala dermatitidis]KAJ4533837.1 hypothetical protein HRR77_008321 [Exophiala dermatitidis]KAJ4540854.1 hypothetical protein HRR76_004238 [Exophiala dermatitidis]KAJ4560487.1 hypothetical protein HRR79_007895 [Exophiala dermatitidis]